MMLAPLLLAGTLTAQVLDDTRGLGARRPEPPPPELEQLRRIGEVIATVRREYVDELDEAMLVERCLKGMDGRLGARKPGARPPAPAPGGRPAERIGEYWRQAAPGPVEEQRALADACLHGMVDDLDRRTEYMDREKFRELQAGARGGMGGLGLELEHKDGHTLILEAIAGAPAASLDLRPGDRILAIDGESIAGLALAEVVARMRGAVDSPIVLTIARAGSAAPLRVEGRRQVVRVQSVRPRQLGGGVLYVRITQFQEATLESLHKELAAGYAAAGPAFRGIVLDLRGNPGGLFHTSIGVAAVFLPEKAAVAETRGRTETANKRWLAWLADYERGYRRGNVDPKRLPEGLRNAPLVVLVDKRTAAGSEIVAAALQDHKRAQVIGEKTYGLGTVQTIIPLGGSDALRLTTARFYRPGGEAIENRAVTPDLEIAHPERFRGHAAQDDPALPAALKALLK